MGKKTGISVGKRVMIMGSAGSGKSTLATKLGEITGIPVTHLDRMFWNPGWVQTPSYEMDSNVTKVAAGDSWIIDGNYLRTLSVRLQRADTIIFLDFNRYICLYRVIKRCIKNYGKTRYDLGEGCPEKMDWPFIKWVWGYPKHSRKAILEAINESGKTFVNLKSRKDVAKYIKMVRLNE
ncbi:MAG: hypothetical protein FWC77_03835 [Defluviitaleaceae bacterium]|nr:hypothetical protein [Defluviitaleaceae bacterium]